ncbi:SGNH/GDSL hydrolase family protein [Pseudarthrobacter sp. MEB009]|uniref:SGNH/GDSL hydrolase family protein n=1 Tax=Pseudarthrobacter sp. MEB009 TaxID=3040326 RepID=UPI00255477BB|nr:SGNH/GDSL hydrolase family protein [Pseudarthrobacter sp. MEB009]
MANLALRRRRGAFAAVLATMAMALGFTAIPAQAAPPPQADYVALGDSYTAGTGAGLALRPAGVACWQSNPGYVDVVGKTGRVNLVANGACHGAVLSQASPFYDRVIVTPTVQEQLASLAFMGAISADTELVSITAGANDVGFSYALGVCATQPAAVCAGTLDYLTSPTNLGLLQAGLAQTYAAIHAAAPNARIAVLGYPFLFDPASPFAPIPAENQQLMNGATIRLNTTIEAAVNTANTAFHANAQYVDMTARFAGHQVNSADPWLQLNLALPTADYNFHPNQAGHRAYASAIMGAVKPAQLARR